MIQTIYDIPEAAPAALVALPAELLMQLQDQAAAHSAHAAGIAAALHHALAMRYAGSLDGTGVHHAEDGGIAVTVTIPKRVKWDQLELAAALDTIRGWGDDPDDYVETDIKVSERRYDAWPPRIRDLFTPARTVETGKPVIRLARADGAD